MKSIRELMAEGWPDECWLTRFVDTVMVWAANVALWPFDMAKRNGTTAAKVAALMFGWVWVVSALFVVFLPTCALMLPFMLAAMIWDDMSSR